ncbi:methyltransferase OMS1 [Plectosphaerella cucumerina]|uniref:Methyltransferase OMS1 n=1 Tax=Plectosphaerella cucumerina TaxID=40658 RepID=A0A8K0T5U2_9PEZI|nr:methyltransferase OMS1 [Plectosphaerella cucumerina]
MRRLKLQLCCPHLRRALHQHSSPSPAKGRGAKPVGSAARQRYQPRALPGLRPSENKTKSDTAAAHETADVIFKARRIPLLAAGVVALGCGLYLSLMISSLRRSGDETSDTETPTGRPPSFTPESARHFDKTLDASENAMGITSLRQKLGDRASGHVLEVAMGTGRNLVFYDWSVLAPVRCDTGEAARRPPRRQGKPHLTTFTGVDVSSDMLGVAVEKLSSQVPGLRDLTPDASTDGTVSYLEGRIRIAPCDIHRDLPFPDPAVTTAQKYDTVVQTFGLCSVRDPGMVLRNLASVVQPGTGRIILVEHGRSSWRAVNKLLDWSAVSHFAKYGCWWNRDIVRLVEDASKTVPGLEVVSIERPFLTQLGTTVWIELRLRNN